MILYHGSDRIIEKPVYPGLSARRDFGPGFYTTDSMDLAKEWACRDGLDGIVNTYQWDPCGLQILDLRDPAYNILYWLTVLTQHRCFWQQDAISETGVDYLQRHCPLDLTPYDAIVGYSADDSAFSVARDFLSGSISLEIFDQIMQQAKIQIVLKSEYALQQIRFVGSEPVSAEEYYPKMVTRDRVWRKAYYRISRETLDLQHDTYLIDLLRRNGNDGDD